MNPREQRAAVVVSVVLAVSAFAVGSAPRWAACLTAALCLLTVVPIIRSRRHLEYRPLILLFLLIAIVSTAVQLIPLPAAVISFIAPHRWAVVEQNAKAWGVSPPSFATLSYDFPGTLVELAKLTGYFAFSYTCLWLAASNRGRRWLMSSAVIVGAAMALTAIGHHLVGTKKLFGLYAPNFPAPSFMAPLLNPNHLAALMAISASLAAGLAGASNGTRRVTWIGLGLLCASVAFLTESRAGAISLVVGAAVAVTFMWRQHRRGLQTVEIGLPKNVIVPAIIMMACAFALVVAFTAGGVAQELSRTTTQQLTGEDYKLDVWRSSRFLIYEQPMTGVGRGAFEQTFTHVHPSGEHTFSHVENEYLQAILDWGFPTAIGLAIVLALIAIAVSRRTMSGPLEAGAIGGLVALALHNFVDFNIEFPAVALPALAAIAVLLPGKPRTMRKRGRAHATRMGLVAAAAMPVVLASLPLGAVSRDEAAALEEALDASKLPPDEGLVEEAFQVTLRHPSDYVGFGLAARALFRRGDRRAIHLMNRALDLNFEHSGLHWLAAQMLASTSAGRDQALVEYGLSLRTARDPRPVLVDLLARFPAAETAARALPRDPVLADMLCYHLSLLSRDDVALIYAQAVLRDFRDNADMAGLVSDFALLRGNAALALTTANQAYKSKATPRNGARLARALNASNRSAEAQAIIESSILKVRAAGTRDELVTLMTLLGETQRLMGLHNQARDTLISAIDLAPDRRRRAQLHRALAEVEDALGNPTVAAVERARAEEIDPTDLPPPVINGPLQVSLPFIGPIPLEPAGGTAGAGSATPAPTAAGSKPTPATTAAGSKPTPATGTGSTPPATGTGSATPAPTAAGSKPTPATGTGTSAQPTGRTAFDLWPHPNPR